MQYIETPGEHHDVQPFPDESDRLKSLFAVVPASVLGHDRGVPLELLGKFEAEATAFAVALAFGGIEPNDRLFCIHTNSRDWNLSMVGCCASARHAQNERKHAGSRVSARAARSLRWFPVK